MLDCRVYLLADEDSNYYFNLPYEPGTSIKSLYDQMGVHQINKS